MKKKILPRSKRVVEAANENFIAAWRSYRNLSQSDLAEKSGVSRSVISRLEAKQLCWRSDQLEPLAIALECHPYELVAADPMRLDVYRQMYEDAKRRTQHRK